MGSYNTIRFTQRCSNCQQITEVQVQFKYGQVWSHEYLLGDVLIWGEPQIGNSNHRRVVVDGAAERCPSCGVEGKDFEVWIENNIIVDVQIASGAYQFSDDTFLIIDHKK